METNTTITVTYSCPFQNICSDNGLKCGTCANNPNRSYYKPIEPYIPYIPYVPSPYWPPTTIWYDTTRHESHYKSV